MSHKTIFFVVIVLLFACSIEDIEYGNPLDPTNPEYVSPETNITYPSQSGMIFSSQTLIVQWEGNNPEMEYRYKLDDFEWSAWSGQKFAEVNYLEEALHTILVQGKYLSGDIEAVPDTVTFEVDAIQGPSLRFYHLYTPVYSDEPFTLDIIAEEVDSVAGAEINVEFNTNHLELDTVLTGNFFSSSGGQAIMFDTLNVVSGYLRLDIGSLGGDPNYLNGTGVIATLNFTPISVGQTVVTFGQATTLRNPNNDLIDIISLVDGIIDIQ